MPDWRLVYYQSNDCTGTPYMEVQNLGDLWAMRYRQHHYFLHTYTDFYGVLKHYESVYHPQDGVNIYMQSRHNLVGGICEPDEVYIDEMFELRKVQPLFTYPVELPIVFE